MNKKIFTLLASSLMLFLTAIVMNAQGYASDVSYLPLGMGKGAYHLKVSSIGASGGTNYASYPAGTDAPLLTMDEDGFVSTIMSSSLIGADYEDLRAALWCVDVSKPEFQGIQPVYNFINKQYQSLLAVDTGRMTVPSGGGNGLRLSAFDGTTEIRAQGTGGNQNVYTLGGQFSNWALSYTYNTTPIMVDQPLLIEDPDHDDWFLTFADNGSNLSLVKVHWFDLQPGAPFYEEELVRFTIVQATPRVLTAEEFNTALYTTDGKSAQLIFDPDVKGDNIENVFAQKLHAVPSVNNVNGGTFANNANYYMNFNDSLNANQSDPSKINWIYVADGTTAEEKADNYYNDLGIYYPIIKMDNSETPDVLGDFFQYDFRLVYYPSEDSVVINVRGIDHTDTDVGYSGDGHAEDLYAYGVGDGALFSMEILDFLTLRMQDLTTALDERVLTISNTPPQTRIHFDNSSCEVSDDRTTVPRNLYVIRDEKGRYLVMPLETGDFTPRWMDLRENEDPMKTPSYQWLVRPMNENSETSPIILTNREFNWVQIEAVQIYKTEPGKAFSGHINWLYNSTASTFDYQIFDGTAILYYPGEMTGDPYLDKAEKGLKWDLKEGWNGSFLVVQDDQKAAAKVAASEELTQDEMQKLHRTSPYIGYKFISADTLSYYTYAFNYLHKFSPDYYLGLNKENNPNDTTVYVVDRKNYFQLELPQEITDYQNTTEKYGIGWADALLDDPATEDIAPLERYYYHFKENDYWNFLFNEHYIVADDNGRYGFTDEYTANTRPYEAAVFYLRFTYQPQGKPEFYSMVERVYQSSFEYITDVLGIQIQQWLKPLDQTHNGRWEVSEQDSLGVMVLGIDQFNLYARTQVKAVGVNPVSTFAVSNDLDPLYRRFNVDELDGTVPEGKPQDDPRLVKIYRTNNPFVDYLYENQHGRNAEQSCLNCLPYDHNLGNGINFAAVENIYDHEKGVNEGTHFEGVGTVDGISTNDHNYAIYLDTAYVNRGTGWIKPQYLLVLAPELNTQFYCVICGQEKPLDPYVYGRFLINATDSARFKDGSGSAIFGKSARVRDEAYIWDTTWERLAFVPAVHVKDTLFILNGHDLREFFWTDQEGTEYLHLTLLSWAAHDGKHNVEAIYLGNNYHKDVVWSMRFIAQDDNENFMLESETTDRDSLAGRMIAPMNGGWVKIQNNELVISRGSYLDAIREAEKWNTEVTTDPPVANDNVAATAVKVIGGQGSVSILNAAGKKVTVSNILGQTVASAVLTSDNATLNAPKGVLVVAVEGENAVKAVVK